MEMEKILQEINGNSEWKISVGFFFITVAVGYMQVFCFAEFIVYIFLFYQLYSHNEIMTICNKQDLDINLGLSRKAMNKRHKKNIISFVGQFLTFLIEMFLTILLILIHIEEVKTFLKQYLGLFPTDLIFIISNTKKAITTITFIIESPELRRYFMENFWICR